MVFCVWGWYPGVRVLCAGVSEHYLPSSLVVWTRRKECNIQNRVVEWKVETSACITGTTQCQPHQISNTQWTENKTTDVVIQQHSRKLLLMYILMSETRWAHKKWNKVATDIKLVSHSSTITMVHGPINTRFKTRLEFEIKKIWDVFVTDTLKGNTFKKHNIITSCVKKYPLVITKLQHLIHNIKCVLFQQLERIVQ